MPSLKPSLPPLSTPFGASAWARPAARIPLSVEFRFAHEPVRSDQGGRFVGRSAELDTLVQRILFSEGGSFLVTGYRGVGKTSFVGQVIRTLREAVAWARPVLGESVVVDVHLTIARPLPPAELMHHIIRRLHDRLAELGVLDRLDGALRERLTLATRRTSMNMTRRVAETLGTSVGVSEATVPRLGFFKAGFSRTRSRTQEAALEYLSYDDKAAEYDVIDIAQRLAHGYRRREGWLQRWLPARAAEASRVGLKIVFVFDELDKLDDVNAAQERPDKPYLDDLLHSLKNLFTTSGMCFVFVAGKDLQERWLEDVGRGDSVYESVFCYDKYLPCMWADVDHLCAGLLDRDRPLSEGDELLFADFKRYLDYRGRGIPRRIIRALNEHVQWVERPYLGFSRDDLRRVRFYAGLERLMQQHAARLFPELPDDGARTVYDKRRLGVYYLLDWILRRGTGEFTAADVVKAARALSAKIALADESAVDVVNDTLAVLADAHYLEEVPLTLGAVRFGDLEGRRERLFRLTLQTRAQVGESAGPGEADGAGAEVFAGRYARLERVAAGGMGVVHKAFDRLLGRPVAIKVLRSDLAAEPQVLARFQQEAHLLQRVRHANVVEFYDAGEADGEHYIAMEFVDGTSLAEVLRGGRRLGVPEAIEIATTVGRVLECLHALQIVRCDIKPGNVLVTREGRVLVTDLGTAKAVGDVRSPLTKTEGPIGTPYYMAPELFEGHPPDARVDLYALGVVLYEMLTGTRPFDEGSVVGTMRAHLERVPPPPSTMVPVPPRLDDLVMRAIARDPDHRFQTARAFVAALKEVRTVAPADLLALVTEAWRQLSVDVARNEAKTEVVATLLGADSPTLHPGEFGQSTGNVSTPVTPMRSPFGSVPPPIASDAVPMSSELPTRSAPSPPLPTGVGSEGSPRRLGETGEVSAPRPPDTTSVPVPSAAPTEAAPMGRPSRLVVVEGPDAGLSFVLPGPGLSATVGRAGVSDIPLSSSALSRVHARLMRTSDGRCLVLDLNSRNGTLVDGINALEPINLEPGATITIGDTTLRVEA